MRIKLLLFFVFLLLFHAIPLMAQQGIFINEVMASNDSIIADNTGDFSDWVEIYNSNGNPVDLNGYYISNDHNNPLKFHFSGSLPVPAGGYLILWASSDTSRGNTHLPFKVSASGESIYLYLPDGITLVDSALLSAQKTDISFGRHTDGSPEFSFFSKPTPGASNNSSIGYTGYLKVPVFSAGAGFYPNPFSLDISSDNPDAQIIYTIDGSIPDTGNINGTVYRYRNQYIEKAGQVVGPFLFDSFRSVNYTGPLPISDASVSPNRLCLKSSTYDRTPGYFPLTLINKGTVVRAIAIKPGYISSEVNTATYFVTPNGINKYTLPVISLAMPENQLFSWDDGIYNAGTDFEQWQTDSIGTRTANWRREVELPLSFELFTPNHTNRELQTNAGWTINGASSVNRPQKAQRIYFRSNYGAPDLNYALYPDLPYKNYERLILSNAGQDMEIAHMRDMVIQTSVKHLRFDVQRQVPSITFINGELWGLLNARERYDDNYFHQKYGISNTELDFIEDRSVVHDGTNTEILSLRSFISDNDISVPANYANVQTRMDVDNFIDYQITEIFFGNNDWPFNNGSCFRKRVPFTPDAPKGQDGRFRWVLHDLDRGLGARFSGGPAYNMLSWAAGTRTDKNSATWSTEMLRKLLANTDFRNKFISRYADLFNTTFLASNIDSVINYFRFLVTPHIAEHIQRWRNPKTVSEWNDSVNSMIQYADQRPFYARQHLRAEFSLGNEQQLTIDVSDSARGFISVNSIDITPAFPGVPKQAYPWTGLYYPEVPVILIAKAKPGYRFTHWEGDSVSTLDTLNITLSTAMSFKAFFESTDVDTASKVIHYWHFNNLPANTLTSVVADTSLPGNTLITYEGTGAGFMDRTGSTEGSNLNLQFDQLSGYGLRPRNPSAGRFLLIAAPTTGYKNIVLVYATTRTTKGAEYQRIYYTTDNVQWQIKADSILVPNPETVFGLQTIDFSTNVKTAHNPKFAIRIEFFGNNSIGTSGNDRFDNITISGKRLSQQDTILPQPAVSVSSDKNNICTNSKVTFVGTPTNAGTDPSF
ncbi:MAG: CotH kinase family protein, partial [Ferruginibacter sp.]